MSGCNHALYTLQSPSNLHRRIRYTNIKNNTIYRYNQLHQETLLSLYKPTQRMLCTALDGQTQILNKLIPRPPHTTRPIPNKNKNITTKTNNTTSSTSSFNAPNYLSHRMIEVHIEALVLNLSDSDLRIVQAYPNTRGHPITAQYT